MSKTKWKDYLLKSGLPLEYEVKKILDERKCQTRFEHSYLRPDENNVINEFSFDISSAYIHEYNISFFDMMIECKYRDESTNWLFIPSESSPIGNITSGSFVHINDHFTKYTKHPFGLNQVPTIALECSKGIEITNDGQNPKTITQAASQLSYAMAEAMTGGMYAQFSGEAGTTEQMFYHLPIIITTANLYRLKENVNIDTIKKSDTLEEISTKEDCLVLKHHIGKDLEKHSLNVFADFIKKYNHISLNKRLKSFNEDIEWVCQVLARHWCPEAVLIIHHSKESKAYDKLFDLMDEIAVPSEKTIPFIDGKKKQQKYLKQLASWRKQQEHFKKPLPSKGDNSLPF